MSDESTLLIGMTLVTIIPRILPTLLAKSKKILAIKEYLEAVPYVIITCLIFPSMVYEVETIDYSGIIGGLCACICSYLDFPVILTFIISVGLYALILTAFM